MYPDPFIEVSTAFAGAVDEREGIDIPAGAAARFDENLLGPIVGLRDVRGPARASLVVFM